MNHANVGTLTMRHSECEAFFRLIRESTSTAHVASAGVVGGGARTKVKLNVPEDTCLISDSNEITTLHELLLRAPKI